MMAGIRVAAISALKRAGLTESLLAVRDRGRRLLDPLRRAVAHKRAGAVVTGDDELVLVRDDGVWEVARVDDRLIVRDAMAANLDLVVTALQRQRIPCLVVPIVSVNRHRVVVAAADRARVLDALAAVDDPAVHLYIDDADLAPRHRRVRLAGAPSAGARSRARRRPLWRVYSARADRGGHTVLGHLHGCEIEFWSPSPEMERDGVRPLVPDRWNKKVAELPPGFVSTASVQLHGRAYPTLRGFGDAPHFDDVTFPVDVVYTWVDGADRAWLERKHAVLRELDLATVHPDAHDVSRFRSRDELRYSLRSVAMFADFVRHVYIVTDDQVPTWLDTDNPRVTLVAHKEIFGGKGRLPTFNSHAIEACLHHIDGLAEHYLYLNDDFLFCRRVAAETFFAGNGLSRFFPSTALIDLDDGGPIPRSVDVAARNSRALVRRAFDRVTHQKMRHAPYPQRRSVLYEAEERFAEEFDRTMSSQIRSPSDIPVPSAFSHYYGYLTGRAVPGTIVARYVELSAPDFDRRLRDLLEKRNADTLCINDADLERTPDAAARERRLRRFLDSYWPVASEFER